eukprot:4510417-Prymnesium_polylepis.1
MANGVRYRSRCTHVRPPDARPSQCSIRLDAHPQSTVGAPYQANPHPTIEICSTWLRYAFARLRVRAPPAAISSLRAHRIENEAQPPAGPPLRLE